MASVSIAVEDPLSERVLRRLINHTRRDWTVGARYPLKALAGGRLNPQNIAEKRGLSGYGQIRAQLPAFNNLAKVKPFIILTDLDIHVTCPGDLWAKWQPRTAKNPNLLFRVAVKEVEAWLLADRSNIADFLEVPIGNVPVDAEAAENPKLEIVNLARLSPSSEVQHALVPPAGSVAEVGRSFDSKLIQFSTDYWDIDEAAKKSPSLRRAVAALKRFNFTE